MEDFSNILKGLPIMYLIDVIAMVVVIVAMFMDGLFGWHKAKERGEARTSYLFSRSITKFALYEGVMLISLGIDTLVHFVWAMFASSSYCVPLAGCLVAIVLCIVEIWSMHEKADEKTRNNLAQAAKIVAEAMAKEEVVDIAKQMIVNSKDKEDEL